MKSRFVQIVCSAMALAMAVAVASPASGERRDRGADVCQTPWMPIAAEAGEMGLTPVELRGDDFMRFIVNFNTTPPLSNYKPDRIFVISQDEWIYIFLIAHDCTVNVFKMSPDDFAELIGPIRGNI